MRADQDACGYDESFVEVGPAIVAEAQSSMLTQPTERSFDDPVGFAQAASMSGVATGDLRCHPTGPQFHPMRVHIAGPVCVQQCWSETCLRQAGLSGGGESAMLRVGSVLLHYLPQRLDA